MNSNRSKYLTIKQAIKEQRLVYIMTALLLPRKPF